jgi:hypothetical protein
MTAERYGHPYLSLEMITGCPFRLLGLSGDFDLFTENKAVALEFLIGQPDIHSWSPGRPFVGGVYALPPDGILPHLFELHLHEAQLLAKVAQRPLVGLAMPMQDYFYYPLFERLRIFKDTLISVSFHGGSASFKDLEQHISFVSECLPKLRHLKYNFKVRVEGVRLHLCEFADILTL